MESASGSDIQRIIGLGKRLDKKTGQSDYVTESYFSFYNHVVSAFEHYPIAQHFGLTVDDAMMMPVDRWYRIRKAGARLAEQQSTKPDLETLFMQLIKELTIARGGGE